jgi:hypothetical protein
VGDGSRGRVSRRPPISRDTSVARTHMYTYDANVWAVSLIQGPFSAAPRQTLTLRFATFASLHAWQRASTQRTKSKAPLRSWRTLTHSISHSQARSPLLRAAATSLHRAPCRAPTGRRSSGFFVLGARGASLPLGALGIGGATVPGRNPVLLPPLFGPLPPHAAAALRCGLADGGALGFSERGAGNVGLSLSPAAAQAQGCVRRRPTALPRNSCHTECSGAVCAPTHVPPPSAACDSPPGGRSGSNPRRG